MFIGYILRPPGIDCETLKGDMEHEHLANMAYAEDRVLDAAGAVIDPFGSGWFPDIDG